MWSFTYQEQVFVVSTQRESSAFLCGLLFSDIDVFSIKKCLLLWSRTDTFLVSVSFLGWFYIPAVEDFSFSWHLESQGKICARVCSLTDSTCSLPGKIDLYSKLAILYCKSCNPECKFMESAYMGNSWGNKWGTCLFKVPTLKFWMFFLIGFRTRAYNR